MNYILAEKLIAEINGIIAVIKVKEHPDELGSIEQCMAAAEIEALNLALDCIKELQQEQPDNEDIDKVAQELYEHLYELKRRNNVPTNLFDKQEIIALWKAGIEYAYNHPKQGQPMPDSTKLIELWHEDKEMLKEKDFRDDPWRLAQNAFMCGFGRGIAVRKQEQPEPSNNLVDVDAVREDFMTEVYRVLDADPTNDRANAIINAFDSLPTVSQRPKVDLVAELKHHLATTPKEQLEKEWKELEPWNNIGPTVQEFLYGKQPEVDLEKDAVSYCYDNGINISPRQAKGIARHFWNKGYNARKEK